MLHIKIIRLIVKVEEFILPHEKIRDNLKGRSTYTGIAAFLSAVISGASAIVAYEPTLLKDAGIDIKINGQTIEHIANGEHKLAAVTAGIAIVSGLGALILGRERAGLETVLAQDQLYMSQLEAAANIGQTPEKS